MRRRIIQYAVNRDDSIVYSRVGSQIAVPVLDFDAIGKGGDDGCGNVFQPGDFNGPMRYHLEAFDVREFTYCWHLLRWTKKIPTELKNRHRAFWNMPLLPESTV